MPSTMWPRLPLNILMHTLGSHHPGDGHLCFVLLWAVFLPRSGNDHPSLTSLGNPTRPSRATRSPAFSVMLPGGFHCLYLPALRALSTHLCYNMCKTVFFKITFVSHTSVSSFKPGSDCILCIFGSLGPCKVPGTQWGLTEGFSESKNCKSEFRDPSTQPWTLQRAKQF